MGEPRLTDRERQVLELVAGTRTNQQIAGQLRISVRRVTAIIAALRSKLPVPQDGDDRVALARYWWGSQTE